MLYTRRDLGKIALASLPVDKVLGAAKINSKFGGVQIGAISWSFNSIARQDAEPIIRAMEDIGLGEIELMSNHAESLAGMPAFNGSGGGGAARGGGARGAGGGAAAGSGAGQGRGLGGGRAPLTPEQQAERQAAQQKVDQWRAAATPATWAAVRKKFTDAGIDPYLLCYTMNDRMKDDDIEYGFSMAKGLGVKAITTSTTLTMAKRIAPIADKHKMIVGYHNHDQTNDPNQTATPESYDTLMAYGKYNAVNLDIGHFTAANYDAVAFIKQHHARITNLHIKDMKRNHGAYTPFGEGDAPIKAVLQLLKTEKYGFPGNIELEYPIPPESSVIAEMKKCLNYCRNCLA